MCVCVYIYMCVCVCINTHPPSSAFHHLHTYIYIHIQTLLKDLASLSPEALQHRVVQLAGELQERTKWEALRLHEAVRKAEVEVSGKYTELIEKLKEESTEELSRQARAFTAEKEMALQRLAEDKEREFKAFFEQEMTNFKQKVTAAFEEQRAKDKAEVEAHAKRTAENIIYENQTKYQETVAGRVEELEKLQAQVQALEEVFKTDTDYEHLSWNVHRITAALLAFELSLLTSSPIQKELDALAKVTKGDPVIDSILSSLPPAVGDGMCVYMCVCIYMCVYVYANMHTPLHIVTHIRILTPSLLPHSLISHTHTYIHTTTQVSPPSPSSKYASPLYKPPRERPRLSLKQAQG